jgi:hypothetical protein
LMMIKEQSSTKIYSECVDHSAMQGTGMMLIF